MSGLSRDSLNREINRFNRRFFDSDRRLSYIGSGSYGGKAQGLAFINEVLKSDFNADEFSNIEVSVPTMTIICTGVFDAFMERNNLHEIARSEMPDDRIAHAFQRADLPFEILGDLHALTSQVRSPLAIRSSSLLEDATYEPFAGVYATKMTPNNQYDPDVRFRKLVEAIKFVYASTFFKSAREYMKVTRHSIEDEKMAVIIQEVVGKRYRDRFYPELSGVARSYNFYPMGRAKHEDGVVNLALGLGKTVVDGGVSWTYSPAYPKVSPPYGSVEELLKKSQTEFWAVNMGDLPAYDPTKETEYLLLENLTAAEADGTMRYLVSTYDSQSGRLTMGIPSPGPRAINFAPLLSLNDPPLNELVKALLSLCENELELPVEIEFAMTFNPHRFGFLQVRPMVVSADKVDIVEEELVGENVLVASKKVLGNGIIEDIQDVVYVKPENFESKHTRSIAHELVKVNESLVNDGCPYLLVVFGRLGSNDPWLGVPVSWGQISGTKVIVEATQEKMNVELSQGSHFFHNIIGLGVCYFSVPMSGEFQINWQWLNEQDEVKETQFVRHVRLSQPLQIKIDGRCGWGVICKS
jgi:hypothetical protein